MSSLSFQSLTFKQVSANACAVARALRKQHGGDKRPSWIHGSRLRRTVNSNYDFIVVCLTCCSHWVFRYLWAITIINMPLMRWLVADGCDLFVFTLYGDKDTSIICQVHKE